MRKLIVLLLMISFITLSGCRDANNPDNPGDENPNNPQDNNGDSTTPTDLTYLEEYYNIMKSKYNQFNARDVHIVYYDEDVFIFRNNVNTFYQYKDGELTEHNIIGSSSSTPGIIRYIKETSTLYYVDVSYHIYVPQNEKIGINTYNFDTKVHGSFTTVDEIHGFTHNHLITETDDNITVYDDEMNVVKVIGNGLYLGYTSHPTNIDQTYSLVASMSDDVCNIEVYLDKLVKSIPLTIECNYEYNLYSRNTGMHFLLGDLDTESYIYHFDVETLEVTMKNTYNSGIEYVDEEITNIYNGIYAFRLSNKTSVVYNSTFTEEQSYVYSSEDILVIGESFYVTRPDDSYLLHDLGTQETTEINSMFLSNSRYSITGDYFIGIIYDGNLFMYVQKIFNQYGENLLTDVVDFRILNYSMAIYIDNMTTSSYEVKLYSFAIGESILLYTHDFIDGEQGRFAEYHVDNDNHIYIVSEDNLSIIEYADDATQLANYNLLGIRNYKGYRILYLITDLGQIKEVLIS